MDGCVDLFFFSGEGRRMEDKTIFDNGCIVFLVRDLLQYLYYYKLRQADRQTDAIMDKCSYLYLHSNSG